MAKKKDYHKYIYSYLSHENSSLGKFFLPKIVIIEEILRNVSTVHLTFLALLI